MYKRLASGLVGALFLGFCGLGVSSAPPPGPAYALHFRPPLGKRLHYILTVEMTGPSTTRFGARFSTTATAHSAGKYTLVTTIDSMTAPGASPDQMKKMIVGTKLTEVVNEKGQILSTKTVGPMKQMMQGASPGSAGAVFPDKSVRIGESWRGTAEAAGPKAAVRVTFVGVKTVGGKQLAILRMLPTSGASPVKTGPITATIETATGVLHTMETTGEMGQTGQSIKMHMSVKLG